ncbi:capsular biosynthesis protein CpsI [Chryseobacterium sp. Leaf404]|uniref:glycosyltransferase family 2 protein n=1 Tax=unclassified Chryseobacterium TaxID=2593645 RepID=UPI0006F59D57|nr:MULTISPECIES: glycosyltransferase family 2 protein [unclassified Chryseobacterium]KQT15520.1 capsular biosynthesis protein CpsI [Chryseobacterium sp. Leaf404]
MKISVIIPVYNAEKYITQAVETALQFDEVFEVILVEDQSPDNALEVCEKLEQKYERVKLFQHPDKANHGAGASRNLGITKATGEFIAFLDADDYYLPNRFDAEKELFKNPDTDGVYGAIGVHYYTEKAKQQFYHIYQDKLDTVYKKTDPKDVCPGQMNLRGSFGLIHLDTLTVRKSAMKKIQNLFEPSLRLHQDTEFTIRLSYYLNLYTGINDKAVAMRGIHENNRITKVETKQTKPATTKILLWEKLKAWSDHEQNLPEEYRKHIIRTHRSFEIANAPFPGKWLMIAKYLISDYKSIASGLYNINFR